MNESSEIGDIPAWVWVYPLKDLLSHALFVDDLRVADPEMIRSLHMPPNTGDHNHDLRVFIDALARGYDPEIVPQEPIKITVYQTSNTMSSMTCAVVREDAEADVLVPKDVRVFLDAGQHRVLSLMRRTESTATIGTIPISHRYIRTKPRSNFPGQWNSNATMLQLYTDLFHQTPP